MRLTINPQSLSRVATAALLCAIPVAALSNAIEDSQAGVLTDNLLARDTCQGGTLCGWNNHLCCAAGSACYTNSLDQAECSPVATTAAAQSSGGYWEYWTSTYTMTDLRTVTSTFSSYYGGVAPTATPACHAALGETPCGSICCASNQYCFSPALPSCAPADAGGSSGYYSTYMTPTPTPTGSPNTTPGLPLLGTSSGETTVTQTASPTTTVPYITPVATGANVTITGQETNNSTGLSGGAIAGIVIGVLAGVFLLGLLCFYCFIAGLIDTILACFGLGRRRERRTVEIDEYERRSSRRNSGGAGRTWFGAPRRPQQQQRRQGISEGGMLLGVGAGLAALWAILGLKRRNERRREEEKYSEYTYSDDYMYTDTSQSSASSDDRRTRDTRRSQSRR